MVSKYHFNINYQVRIEHPVRVKLLLRRYTDESNMKKETEVKVGGTHFSFGKSRSYHFPNINTLRPETFTKRQKGPLLYVYYLTAI